MVSGASGFMGQPLVRRLRADGHDVVQLVRRDPRWPGEVRWDPASGRLDDATLDGVGAVINLNGVNLGDRRWSAEFKELIRSSRVDAARTLATAMARADSRPSVLLTASGIDYYGSDRGEEVLTEESPPGDGFLPEVVRDWEEAATPAADAGVRVVLLRTGIVLGRGGGAMGRLLPLFRLGLGGRIGTGKDWWSWISLEDQLAAMRFLLETPVAGPVNLTAPEPARNAELTAALARALHRPAVAAAPKIALRVALGEYATAVTGSKRVLPTRLLEAGYRYRHPDLDSACRWLVEHG